MKTDYDNLLSLTIEIEGLLLLLSQGHSNAPERVAALLEEKVKQLHQNVCEECCAPTPETEEEQIAEAATFEATEDSDPFDADDDTDGEEIPSDEPIAPVETQETQETQEQPEPEPKPMPKPVKPDTKSAEPMKLDEKLTIEGSRDIRRAFTLNDRFRFRRELFENSEARFVEALDVISAMSSFDEAQEYFYDDLCWDPESEHVKEFMQKVLNHFR